MRVSARPVFRGEALECRDDGLGRVPHGLVTRNEIGIAVEKPHRMAGEAPGSIEIEKDSPAAEKRLPVLVEGRRIETTNFKQELPLAAGPFQKWAWAVR